MKNTQLQPFPFFEILTDKNRVNGKDYLVTAAYNLNHGCMSHRFFSNSLKEAEKFCNAINTELTKKYSEEMEKFEGNIEQFKMR